MRFCPHIGYFMSNKGMREGEVKDQRKQCSSEQDVLEPDHTENVFLVHKNSGGREKIPSLVDTFCLLLECTIASSSYMSIFTVVSVL